MLGLVIGILWCVQSISFSAFVDVLTALVKYVLEGLLFSLHRVHANLCIAPILVYMLPKRALKGFKLNLRSLCFDVGQMFQVF